MNILKLTEELVRDEGEILHAYRDSLGYLTIGVGHLIDKTRSGSISKATSRFILAEDIAQKMAELDRHLPWWRDLSDNQQRVLVNMCFNLGIGGLLKFEKTLLALKSGDYNLAAKEMLDSRWAVQVGKRAERLAEMVRKG